jgi:hypothetical protein
MAGRRLWPEDRAVVSGCARAELPAEVWLEARARADPGWMQGDCSTRYRLRLEINREFTVLEHAVPHPWDALLDADARTVQLRTVDRRTGTVWGGGRQMP